MILVRPARDPRAWPYSMPRAGTAGCWTARRATRAAIALRLTFLRFCRACWWRPPRPQILSLALMAVLSRGPLSVLGGLTCACAHNLIPSLRALVHPR
ncbi:hypothetical protein XAR_3798 [Xanthomonas citri pv. glycines str. 8ra]|nr:hypothetical protein XAR_3798 [Xanthomonas citri pv. glycines str. 8ra]